MQSSSILPNEYTSTQDEKNFSSDELESLPSCLRECVIPADHLVFNLNNQMGSGKTGLIVGSVLTTAQGEEKVAIKCRHSTDDLITEAVSMKGLQSKYIAEFKGIYKVIGREYLSTVAIVMKRYASSLDKVLKKSKSISYEQKLKWARDISYGLHDLHQQHLIHCDLKSGNIFLDEDNNAKIGDFGEAYFTTSSAELVDRRGTLNWSAPELFREVMNTNTAASDIYSLGVVFWEIVTGKIPFAKIKDVQVMYKKMNNIHESIPVDCPDFFESLISDCWKNDSERPTAQSICDRLDEELMKLKKPESALKQSDDSILDFKTSTPKPIISKKPEDSSIADDSKTLPSELTIPIKSTVSSYHSISKALEQAPVTIGPKTPTVAFEKTSQRHHELFKSQPDVSCFYAASVEQDKAEPLLKEVRMQKH